MEIWRHGREIWRHDMEKWRHYSKIWRHGREKGRHYREINHCLFQQNYMFRLAPYCDRAAEWYQWRWSGIFMVAR